MSRKMIRELLEEYEKLHASGRGILYTDDIEEINTLVNEEMTGPQITRGSIIAAIMYAWQAGFAAGYRSGRSASRVRRKKPKIKEE